MRRLIPLIALLNLAAAPTTQVVDFDPSATLITAKLEKVSAAQLFNEIARQGGTDFRPLMPQMLEEGALANAIFTAEFDRQPFWSAVLESCEQANVAVMEQPSFKEPDQPQLALETTASRRPNCFDGPVLFVLQQIERTNQISYGDPARRRQDHVRITAAVLLEPKLRRYATIGPTTVNRAVDDAGNALKAVPPPRLSFLRMPGVVGAPYLSFAMEYPDKPGQRLKEVSGAIELTVPKRMFKAQIPFADGEARLRAGADELTVRTFRPTRALLEMTLTLMREEEDDEAWMTTARHFSSRALRVTVQSKAGPLRQMGNNPFQSVGPDRVLVCAAFQENNPAAALENVTIEYPTQTQTIAAKFKFDDLPMP